MADAHTSCALMAGLNENIHLLPVSRTLRHRLTRAMDTAGRSTDPNMPPGERLCRNITCTSDMMPNHTMLQDNGMAGRFLHYTQELL